MSNITALQVQAMHVPIPDADLADPIPTFITDAETWLMARLSLCGIKMWTDATEPAIAKLIIKHRATWFELKRLYGSQVDEFHDWVENFKEEPEQMVAMICKLAEMKAQLPPGLEYSVSDPIRSKTKGRVKIFTLQDEKDWAFHPEDDDKRYGEPA